MKKCIEVKSIQWLSSFIGTVLIIHSSINLINKPDDVSVGIGIAMLVLTVSTWSYVARTRIQKWIATNKKEN
jgi:hypothetical protein